MLDPLLNHWSPFGWSFYGHLIVRPVGIGLIWFLSSCLLGRLFGGSNSSCLLGRLFGGSYSSKVVWLCFFHFGLQSSSQKADVESSVWLTVQYSADVGLSESCDFARPTRPLANLALRLNWHCWLLRKISFIEKMAAIVLILVSVLKLTFSDFHHFTTLRACSLSPFFFLLSHLTEWIFTVGRHLCCFVLQHSW